MIQSAGEALGISWRGLAGVSGQFSGTMGSSNVTATTMRSNPFWGMYTAQSAAMPTLISQAHLRNTGVADAFIPAIVFENEISAF